VPGVALIAHFDGDPSDLASRFHVAASRYAESSDTQEPTAALLLRNRTGITVVLVWPEGSSLAPFRTFLKGAADELGLPPPRTEHLRAEATTWDAITKLEP
jgi:hypothetical protein